jgi:hypothetical protein
MSVFDKCPCYRDGTGSWSDVDITNGLIADWCGDHKSVVEGVTGVKVNAFCEIATLFYSLRFNLFEEADNDKRFIWGDWSPTLKEEGVHRIWLPGYGSCNTYSVEVTKGLFLNEDVAGFAKGMLTEIITKKITGEIA